ncbi:MAG: SMP-30/gluconolactonase/LRE family protein [Pirellulales bacterium]|nr:SMP-30/gluconolactonase/LRE family protein [Pirellulales bacterium]MBL7182654.1 SMP-30/gluconolactonase/LRE family protein [Pirellulales bacterium]
MTCPQMFGTGSLNTAATYISLLCLCLPGSLALGAKSAGESPVDPDGSLVRVGDTFSLPDGPAWDGSGELVVSDVKDQSVHCYRPVEKSWKAVPIESARYSGFFVQCGTLYAADNGNGVVRRFPGMTPEQIDAAETYSLGEPDKKGKPPRPNDLVVDRQGNIYVTVTGRNEVVCVRSDGTTSVATTGVISPNGITMSPDEKTLYVASYKPKTIEKFPVVSPGVLGDQQRFAVMDDGDAPGADGMAIDSAGNVYCAGATAVWIWNSAGQLLETVECPTRPINATFGGADRKTLFIACFDGVYALPMKISGVKPADGLQAN